MISAQNGFEFQGRIALGPYDSGPSYMQALAYSTPIVSWSLSSLSSGVESTVVFGASDTTNTTGELFTYTVVSELNNEWVIPYTSSRYGNGDEVTSLSKYAMLLAGNNLISLTEPEWKAFASSITSSSVDCSSNLFCASIETSCS